jgi:hypothetical protein
MPDAQCVRYAIKPGQREALVSWVARLKDRSTEVTEVMAEVGFIAEAVFMERTHRGDYLLIYTSAKDLPAANEACPDLDCRWLGSSINSWLRLWTWNKQRP